MLNIKGYQIITQIYESANSAVYRGLREQDNQPLIIKMLQQNYPSPQEIARYHTEYNITKSLNIPGVVKTYGLQSYQNTLVIFLEDFGGESLKNWIEQDQFTVLEFLEIAIIITEILEQIHAANIIHKDLNPANIVYNPNNGEIKIIDFGISTQLNRENPTIKNPNIIEGTLAYISPEQTGRMNRSLDYRTDFYSLGVTFYKILTEKLPFETTDPLELVHCHIAKQPVSPSDINPKIPLVLSKIIDKMMAKTAEDRYQTAYGLKADLEECLKQLKKNLGCLKFPLGRYDISDKFQLPQKLYGREREIETLLTAFDRVSNPPESPLAKGGQRGSELMLISGYSGIGKSLLVQEIYKPITAKRGYFIKGKFDQFQRNIPYSAVVNALRELIKQLLTETENQLSQWREQILTAVGVNGQIIIDVIPEVELIIGKQPSVPEMGPNESQNRFNFVFQNFIKVFTQPEHPLVLFLDDLQWADSASLKLMQLLMSNTSTGLFLIGAYRDNEVYPAHPLVLTIDEIGKNGPFIERIFLSPLDLFTISQLLSDALNTTLEQVRLLAELVLLKTGGNPFFIREFLGSLYTEELLKFDRLSLSWSWDLNEIKQRGFTDNVVELMTQKIQKLPSNTQNILKIGAAIGNQFNLAMISAFESASLGDIVNSLDLAIRENLVMPLDAKENIEIALLPTHNYQLLTYKFIHDRIQQAAYSLIPENAKQATHLKIGQLILQNSSDVEIEEKIFDIVGNFNLGIELITEPKEREKLAELNLKAGIKARNATAYAGAMIYLQTGIDLLTENCWQNQYELTLNLYVAATEAAYLNADLEGMEQMADQVLQNAQNILDKMKIYAIQIPALTAQSQMLEAIALGRDALKQLGVELHPEPDETKLKTALDILDREINGRAISTLIDLPVMTDRPSQIAMELLAMLTVPVFIGMPGLMPLISFTMVSLSLQFGNTSASTVGYQTYSMVLCAFFGEVKTGYEFGLLAINLADRFNTSAFKSGTLLSFGTFVEPYQKPLMATRATLKAGYMIGIETGAFLTGGYNITNYVYTSFFSGVELSSLEQEIVAYRSVMAQIKQSSPQTYLDMKRQVILNLMETVEQTDCLIGNDYDERVMLPKHYHDHEFTAIAQLYIYKLLLAYLWGNYSSAKEYIAQANPCLMGVAGMIFIPIFHFYAALTFLALYQVDSTLEQTDLLAQIENHQLLLHQWAEKAPINHQHKWHLIEAEKHRIAENRAEALQHYDLAISLAKENQFIQEEALAHELASKFYLSWGKEKIAQNYMQSAHYAYTRWGAIAKVKYLEKKYPKLLNLISSEPGIKGRKNTRTLAGIYSNTNLDLATVMKASQAISGKIVLDELLRSLMKIIIENAGAQLGYLVLENQGQLLIEASGVVHDNDVKALQSIPVENNLPITIINYVARLKEDVVLQDATKEGKFINDPYIVTYRPKSILCTPLINKCQLIGIVYLENNLTTGAFNSTRLEVIKLLSGQAAIALENAGLYQNLENKVVERTAQLEEANQQISTLNEKLQAENLRLSAELGVAKKLQKMVLPKPEELEGIKGLEIAGYMEPADEVGGDYYDVLSGEHGVKIAIGDVTGHGLESGVLMLMAQTAVRTLQKVNETDPVRFLDIINQTLYDNLQRMNSDKNMTLAILDYVDGVVKLIGQHEEVIVIRVDGTIEKIDTINLGFPIGLDANISDFIAQKTVRLNSQDLIILYTDGITEAANMENELYGLDKLCQVVAENRELPAQEIPQKVIDDLRQFIGDQKVFDDITLVVLKQK